jgi:hypothetical protein
MKKKIVETDNFGRDYPNERFLPIPILEESDAKTIVTIINNAAGPNSQRYWKIVELDYLLSPSFEQ